MTKTAEKRAVGRPKVSTELLVPYATRITGEHRELLDTLEALNASVASRKGQRLLLEDMTQAYLAARPEVLEGLRTLQKLSNNFAPNLDEQLKALFGSQFLPGNEEEAEPAPIAAASAPQVEPEQATPETSETPKPVTQTEDPESSPIVSLPEAPEGQVWAAEYEARPNALHLVEAGARYGSACSLKGKLNLATLQLVDKDKINCGKCRYCRKAVFK